jgi:tetrapyrrole methylase family protein/MazG family protein
VLAYGIISKKEVSSMHTFSDLVNITSKLRSKDGCPWDKEQTHESLKQYLLEEAGEVIEAIDHKDKENLCEELGDLLFQVMIHSQIAKENQDFTIDDVVNGICEKMIRRHPHVFGDKKVISSEEGEALWEAIKMQEKAREKSEKP